jgi:hypothetical protein
MLKSLTKETFWNELIAKYPELMDEFKLFIDEYKKRVSWPDLIGSYIKYHDLPVELQVGVFIQWTMQRGSINNFMDGTHVISMDQFATAIKDWFKAETDSMIDDLFDQVDADTDDDSGFISHNADGTISVRKDSPLDKMLSASPKNRDRVLTGTITCHLCHGSGEMEDNGPKPCSCCGGNGYLEIPEYSQSEPYPIFPQANPAAIAKPVKGADEESE